MSSLLMAAVATLVFCAPGSPGGAEDAKPFVEKFAAVAASTAGWAPGTLTAVYDPTEHGGMVKLADADAALAFVPYAFFVQHAAELHLSPLVQADVAGIGTQERWSLVAKAGTVSGAGALAGYSVLSIAGYAPEFVRHSALAAWTLPSDVNIESTGQVLSSLRRVAAGEHVVALLDQTQAAAMPTLPFAQQLQPVLQSPPLPVALIAVVGGRISKERAKSLQAALLKMGQTAAAVDVLSQLHLQGFVLPQLPGSPASP